MATERDRVPGYRGEVWLGQHENGVDHGAPKGWMCRWEAICEGCMETVEVYGPAWGKQPADAIAWARERAPVVLLTYGHPWWEYWSVGDEDPAGIEIPRDTDLDHFVATRTDSERRFEEMKRHTEGLQVELIVGAEGDVSHGAVFAVPDKIEPAGGFAP